MNVQHVVDYWRKTAAADRKAAQSLFEKRSYPHSLFFGHLYIEKMLKAIVVHRTGKHAPYGHNLLKLAERAGLDLTQEQRNLLDRVTKYNLETRYPEDTATLYKQYTRKLCESELSEIHKVGKWLASMLK